MVWVCLGMGGEGEQRNHEKLLFSSLWLNFFLKFSSGMNTRLQFEILRCC